MDEASTMYLVNLVCVYYSAAPNVIHAGYDSRTLIMQENNEIHTQKCAHQRRGDSNS